MFKFYGTAAGADWYMCTCCGNKTRGKPNICPVCKDEGRLQEVQKQINQGNSIDDILSQFKSLEEKYGRFT